jgi:cytochrome P450
MTDGLELVSPQHYGDGGYPHDTWTRLRQTDPVAWFEPQGYRGFWAITKHADICEVSKQPDRFLNAPRITIANEEFEAQAANQPPLRTIVHMDPPEHRDYRKLASPWFTPRNLGSLEARLAESARSLVNKMMRGGGSQEGDFVTDVAAPHPLRLLAHLFGIPKEDEPFILKFTNEMFGGEDPEFKRASASDEDRVVITGEVIKYFAELTADRRARPRDDLASVLANAEVGNAQIGDPELLSYYFVLLTAGHETTRNALSGGLLALIEHPDQLKKLQENPEMIETATDEILRWTTPVIHFARTATCDYELRGSKIRKGDSLALFYPSANRDEEVFEDPFEFRIDRDPNPHLAFGIGEHFCLGSKLARMEVRLLFEELVPRLEEIELLGPPDRLWSSLVGGVKHLPVRYQVRA